ncbi:hypothetical protein [Streptomyces sp. NPDC102360]|uniref:hypothetical protein n=1 Tax=Streptomyces sp. NPDC102360 TaxID=3366160 RepID=UPI003801FBA0
MLNWTPPRAVPRSVADAAEKAAGAVTTGRQATLVSRPTSSMSAKSVKPLPNTSPGSRRCGPARRGATGVWVMVAQPFNPEVAMPCTR